MIDTGPSAETDSQGSREIQSLLFDTVADVIFVIGVEPADCFRFLMVNPAFLRATQLRSEQVVGKRIEDVLPEAAHELVIEKYHLAMSSRRSVTWEETSIYPAGELTGQVTISPSYDAGGVCTHLVGSVHDLTDIRMAEKALRKSEEQLYQSQRLEMIGTLTGGLAHDFNNILQAIHGLTDLCLDEVDSSSQIHDDLEGISQAAERATEIVRRMLAFSRPESRGCSPIEIGEVVREALKLVSVSSSKAVEIREQVVTHCKQVVANPGQIHQVVMNLCTNACQAMGDAGGVLTVSLQEVPLGGETAWSETTSREREWIVLTVEDSGPGMDRVTLERVFDPFFTTREFDTGTGLGLSVVHGIVRSHGGMILAESDPGKGARFMVYLPTVDSTREPIDAEEETPTRGNERLLLVDDEESVAAVLKRSLEMQGYRVTSRKNGVDALATFRAHPNQFDLVISDQVMPGMTGLELTQRLLRLRPGLPIILLSGYSRFVTPEVVEAEGIRKLLSKPLTGKDLAQAIRCVLESDGSG